MLKRGVEGGEREEGRGVIEQDRYSSSTYLALQFLMVLSDSLRPRSDSLVHFCSPVYLIYTDGNLPRPFTHPLDTRIHSISLQA